MTKIKVCPLCNEEMSNIVYGYPTSDLVEIAKSKNWILGGCTPTSVEFYCRLCRVSWSHDLGFDYGQSDI